MNLYLIELKNGNKYYVVEDDGNRAWEKLKEWCEKNLDRETEFEWLKISNIASNWSDERIGVFF